MEIKMEKAERFPLFINLHVPVACRGDFASVTMKARVLVEKYEDGEFWMYGINPGGICTEGDSLESAHRSFSERLLSKLFAAAEEAADFLSFSKDIREFFQDVNRPYLDRWKQALEEVRAGKIDIEKMPREPGESEPTINIERIVKPEPAHNLTEELARAA